MTDHRCWICRDESTHEHRGVKVCARSSCVQILNVLVAHHDYFDALVYDTHAQAHARQTADPELQLAVIALPNTFHRTPEPEKA